MRRTAVTWPSSSNAAAFAIGRPVGSGGRTSGKPTMMPGMRAPLPRGCLPALPGGQLTQAGLRRRQKALPLQQILGGIAGEGQLGEDDQIGAAAHRVRDRGLNQLAISVEVSNCRIDLPERDSHARHFTRAPPRFHRSGDGS